jgi:hypothetical protein
MRVPTLSLAAALMLGGMTAAYAQRGDMPGPGQGMERGGGGPSMDMPRGGDGPRGGAGPSRDAGPRGGGPSGDGASSGDEGLDSPRGDRPIRRSEGPAPDDRKGPPKSEPSGADGKGEGPDSGSKTRQKTSDEMKGDRGHSRKERAAEKNSKEEGRGKDKSPDKTADDTKAKDDAQAKSADRAGDADKSKSTPRKDAAESKPDKPDNANKQAQGDRKPLDEVKKADITGDRKERVTSAFRDKRDVTRRTDVDINISIGAHLPSAWDYEPVPVAVIDVIPEYRGYSYAYVEDEYVIVDPVTYEVVAVLPAPDGPQYAGGGGGGSSVERCATSLTLTDDERIDLLKTIQLTDEAEVSDVTVGWSVPSDIELRTFPEPILSRTGKLSACRYFVVDDQIAIVDPAEDTVVLLVEQE